MFAADSGGVYGYARSEPPIYGAAGGGGGTVGRKVPPRVPPKPSVSGVLFPGGGGGSGDVIDILNLPKKDATKEDARSISSAAAVRNITHV